MCVYLKDNLFFSNFETTFAMHDGRKSEIPVPRSQGVVWARYGSIRVEMRSAVRVRLFFSYTPCLLFHENLPFFKTLGSKGLSRCR